MGTTQALPLLQEIDSGIYGWIFNSKTNIADWRYPHTVDMAMYRKNDVKKALDSIPMRSPNTMEANWAMLANNTLMKRMGLCFDNSIVINIPVNQVQTEWQMPYMHSWTPEDLLEMFESGLKIDITPFSGIKNNMCHMNYELRFKLR